MDWSWEPIVDDGGRHEVDGCMYDEDHLAQGSEPSVREGNHRPSGSADPVGRSFDEVEGSPKNDVTLSRRQAEDLLEILAEFRTQHLREAAWDYPMFDFQRRMLVNLGEIETQVYQSMQGLSE